MDFNQVIQEYNRLLELYQSRQITRQAFEDAIHQLTATDAFGRFWHFDPNTGQWMRFENGQWLPDTPPSQAPVQPPAQAYPPQPPMGYSPQPGYAPPGAPSSNKTLWIVLSALLGLAVIVLIVLLATGAFNPKAAPTAAPATPIVSPTTPTVVAQPSPTLVAQPSPTLLPSMVAPTKTLPPTLVPSATLPKSTNVITGGLNAYLTPGVHYLLYSTQTSIFLVQPDGKSVQLNQDDVVAPDSLRAAISPRGGLVAFITSSDTSKMTKLTLHVVRLSDAKELVAIPLTNPSTELNPNSKPGDPAYETVMAITYGNISWSDSGRFLAYVGARSATSTDVYLLDVPAMVEKRLSSDPSYAFSPRISPDGNNLVFFGATSFGTGAGFSMAGVWVVPTNSTAGPVELYKPTATEEFLGWVSTTKIVVQSVNMICGAHNLRQINITTKVITPLIETCFQRSALDPKTSAIMVATDAGLMSMCNCGKKVDPGLYFISPTVPMKQVDKGDYNTVYWAEGPQFFTGVRADKKLTGWKTAGTARILPANLPYSVPQGNGMYIAWAGNSEVGSPGLTISFAEGDQASKAFNDHVQDLTFNADYSALFFISKDKLYVALPMTFAPKAVGNVPGATQIALAIQQ